MLKLFLKFSHLKIIRKPNWFRLKMITLYVYVCTYAYLRSYIYIYELTCADIYLCYDFFGITKDVKNISICLFKKKIYTSLDFLFPFQKAW